nr:outer membrane protein transport protein [Bacteroidota bacterium]
MKKIILTTGILFLFLSALIAQNEEDVLRYSSYQLVGTARYMGLGGATGAIGADFSATSSNPAGIGLYKRSEFSISPSLYFGATESAYNGKSLDDSKNNFAMGNVGMVMVFEPIDRLDKNPLQNYQVAIGLNRLKDFNNRTLIEGINDQNSLLDAYLEYAGSKSPVYLNEFDTRLAFDTYLIDTVSGAPNYTYVNAYSYIGGFSGALQRKSIVTKGSMNEWVISGGMNMSDRFYLGLTFGFPYIRYYQESTYSEINQNPDTLRDLKQFNYYENLETRGAGFNVKVGAIYKLTQWFRVGAAFHSPTWFNSLKDKWNTSIDADYQNGDSFTESSPRGEYSYDIQTPWRAIGSATFLLGTRGLISAEYEYVDYSKARLRPSIDFSDVNEIVESKFDAANNVRVGAEFNLGMVQVRGGYAYYGSPFKSGVNGGERNIFSGGAGYRNRDFSVDAVLSYATSELDYYLYGTENVVVNPATINLNNYSFMVTLGFRFD